MMPGREVLVAVLVLVAALVGVLFFHGRRRNRSIALRVSRELERALEPVDATYTWIGGLIGFHARFAVHGYEKVRATCTLLPRHAPLYLPVALALGRGDQVHVTLYLSAGFGGEAHIVAPSLLRSPLFEIRGRDRMREAVGHASGSRFVLLGTTGRLVEGMRTLLHLLERAGLAASVLHLAFVPDLCTLYARVRPRRGAVEGVTRLLAADARRIVLAQAGSRGDQESDSGDDMGGRQ
jgi:hypothetical protein